MACSTEIPLLSDLRCTVWTKEQQRAANKRHWMQYGEHKFNMQTIMDLPAWIVFRMRELRSTAEECSQELDNTGEADKAFAKMEAFAEVLEFLKSEGFESIGDE